MHEAEDAVHDVLVSLWKSREEQDIESLRLYLSGALKYAVLRTIYRRRIFGNTKVIEDKSIVYNDTQIDNRNVLSLIWEHTAELPEKCRIIFRLSRFHGLSNTEIAQTLNISGKTVENQINKAQKKIKLSLKNF